MSKKFDIELLVEYLRCPCIGRGMICTFDDEYGDFGFLSDLAHDEFENMIGDEDGDDDQDPLEPWMVYRMWFAMREMLLCKFNVPTPEDVLDTMVQYPKEFARCINNNEQWNIDSLIDDIINMSTDIYVDYYVKAYKETIKQCKKCTTCPKQLLKDIPAFVNKYSTTDKYAIDPADIPDDIPMYSKYLFDCTCRNVRKFKKVLAEYLDE